MDLRKRLSLIIVFLLGLFTVVCSVMRMIQIRQVAKDGNNSSLLLWGAVEMNVGVSPDGKSTSVLVTKCTNLLSL